MNQIQKHIEDIKQNIIQAHQIIQVSILKVRDEACTSVKIASEIGNNLLLIKKTVGHGNFETWMESNLPELSESTYQRYMLIARKWNTTPELAESGSLRSALALCLDSDTDKDKTPARHWDPDIDGLKRATTFRRFLDDHPFEAWPAENRQALKEEIEPLAKRLWPEKFQSA